MQNNIKIKADMKKDVIKFIQVQQNDDMVLTWKILENGLAKDLTGCNVALNYVNANNTVTIITPELVTISGNTVTVTCPRNCTRSSGIAKAQLVITSDTKQVSSFSIDLIIIESILMNQEVSKNVANLLEELQEALNKADIDIDTLNKLIATAEIKIANLLAQNNAATTNIVNLTAQNNAATPNIANLKAENIKAPPNIANLKVENDKVPSNISNLGVQNTNATANIASLTSQNNSATSNITNLTSQNTNATANINNIKMQNTDAANKINNLTNQNGVANTNLKELEDGLLKGKNLLDELNSYDAGKKANIEEVTGINSVATELKTFYLDTDNSYSYNGTGAETLYRQARFYNKNRNVYHFETDSNEVIVRNVDADKYDNENLSFLLKQLIVSLGQKQPITDNTLTTTAKAISAAINELDLCKTEDSTLVGMIAYFARSTAPTGFLKCNGALVNRTTYARLFATIGTTFGAGDGKTTFALPDLRGEFVKGWDDGRGADNGRIFGSWKGDQAQLCKVEADGYGLVTGSVGFCNRAYVNTSVGNVGHPRNVALLACIKC